MKTTMKLLLLLVFFHGVVAWAATPVQKLARAIAKAEGFGVKGAKPTRFHNPGDIRASRGVHYAGQVGTDRFGYVIFRRDADGWAALERVINKLTAGVSGYYNVNMTLKQFSKRYATSPTWVKNVAKNLACQPSTEMWEILDVPPVLLAQGIR